MLAAGRRVSVLPGKEGLNNVMVKMNRVAAGSALIAVVGLVASCSSVPVGRSTGVAPTPDPYTGIEWSVREFATTGTDHEVDEHPSEGSFGPEPSTRTTSGAAG